MTSATDTDLACSVYVDGQRLADTAAEYLASVPTVLAGLVTNWGRGNSLDQPAASTCTFEVRDIGGDADFLTLLHVGRTVDVFSSAPIGNPVPTDIAEDGTFETAPASQRVTAHTVTVTSVWDAAASNTYFAIEARAAGTVDIPPAPWGTSVDAWDGMPSVTPGESWTVTLDAWPATTQTAGTLALALFASPLRAAPVALLASAPLVAGTTSVTAVIPDSYPVAWVGAVVSVAGAIVHWTDVIGAWNAQVLTWQQFWPGWNIDNLTVIAPPQARKRVSVFRGRITDLIAKGVPGNGGVSVSVTATDLTADLANDIIGDNPWLAQGIGTRVARIRTLAATPFVADIPNTVSPIQVSWRDVDAQPVMTLLQELAVTSDSVLWSAFNKTRGFYLWFEDPLQRQSMAALTWNADHTLVIIVSNTRPIHGTVISACEILLDSVTFEQDVTDVITRIDLTWLQQTLDDDGLPAPTERHITEIDADSEKLYGVRSASYGTQLINEADGTRISSRVLLRSRNLGWHVDSAVWDIGLAERTPEMLDTALALLDGTQRIGMPLVFTDLPVWTPAGSTVSLYLEGGTYTYSDGEWSLAMTLSPAGYTGASAKWKELDVSYRWRDFDPTIAWLDLWGVAGTAASELAA